MVLETAAGKTGLESDADVDEGCVEVVTSVRK